MTDDVPDVVQGGLTDQEKRENVIRLVFDGHVERFREFCQLVEDFVPPGVTGILRGSAVTGHRWRDDAQFDADGPGSSDLDLTLVGDAALLFFKTTGFYVPGLHSRPLSDVDPDIAPDLVPLRHRLMEIVKRPVNIQGTRDLVTQVRGDYLGQPYLTLFAKPEGLALGGHTTRV